MSALSLHVLRNSGYRVWLADRLVAIAGRLNPRRPWRQADELARLRAKVQGQAHQLHYKDQALHDRNVLLDALHVVWCSGGCPGGVHRYTGGPVTEEMVVLVERQAKRLRTWWNTANYRLDQDNNFYGERLARKVERTPDA